MPLSDAPPASLALPDPVTGHSSNPKLKPEELSCAVGIASAEGSARLTDGSPPPASGARCRRAASRQRAMEAAPT